MEKARLPKTPDSPLTVLSGISETRAKAFEKLGITTLSELCRHYPRTYEDRGRITTVSEAKRGEVVSLILTVGTQPHVARLKQRMTVLKFRAYDASGSCNITYFNQDYLKSSFRVGGTYRFYGKTDAFGGTLSLTSPKWEALPEHDMGDGGTLPAIYPIYALASPLTQNLVAKAVREALAVVYPQSSAVIDPIPDDILHEYRLCDKRFAMENVHMPSDLASADAARKRLIFEELLYFALGLKSRRLQREKADGIRMQEVDMAPFLEKQPYQLTGAQSRAIAEFSSDMTSGRLMMRLLSGDVGSGKTVCAAAAIYIAVKNGYQAALMAPTEILARQHFADLAPMFEELGFRAELLVGSTRAKEKTTIKKALSDGTLPIVIGTHALLESNVTFARCGLVIADEQHRFGVGQRAALTGKGYNIHTLIMSATPIPRTLALMLFGDLDMSVLDEMPPGRQKVSTFAVDESYRDRLNGFIRKQVEEGHQVYIVCPAIDEDEAEMLDIEMPDTNRRDTKAAVAFASELANNVFSDLSVGVLHGKMKASDKDEVMRRFVQKEIMILVSTTVIEVGVNVPSATLMVVENAEYFGLSQLHQLRGRVGRGKDKSWCILVSDAKGETARARLDTLCKTSNGYEVAQKDLELRGPGDFFAATGSAQSLANCRQSGGIRFEIASFCDDVAFIEKAFAAAERILSEDPRLTAPKHAPLKAACALHGGIAVM